MRVGLDGGFSVSLEPDFLLKGGGGAFFVARLVLFFLKNLGYKFFIFNGLGVFLDFFLIGFVQCAYELICAMRKFGRYLQAYHETLQNKNIKLKNDFNKRTKLT